MLKKRNGFTLMEIIIAIALVGIIAVGLIPAFATQFKMTMDTRDLTVKGFNAQGVLEDDIQITQELLRENGPYDRDGDIPTEDGTIFGREVSMFKLSKVYPLNDNKKLTVFLSEKLAEMSYRNPLIASMVRIDGENNSGVVKEGVEVVNVNEGSDFKLVKGAYKIQDYSSIQDLNLYRWYRSTEGFADPKFPDDYEFMNEWRNRKTIPREDLKALASNRFLMLALIPVDKSGVRGAEKPSTNRVYIQGKDWREGIFAWVDKNENGIFDEAGDIPVKYKVGSRDNWPLIKGFDSGVPFPSPDNPEINLDPKDGSLYVPMGVERNRISDKVGLIELKTTDTGKFINWNVDRNIHFANAIKVYNNTDIVMTTEDGGISLYQYASINSSGEAVYNTDGSLKLENSGAELLTNKSIILMAGGKGLGNISIEPYTSLNAADNITISATEKTLIKESKLTAGNDITLSALNGDITLAGTTVTARNLYFNNNGSLLGGSWSAGTKVVVPDGKILTAGKGKSIIANNGSLDLGNTGALIFTADMGAALSRPLELLLAAKSSHEVSIATKNYIRNIGYGGNTDYKNVSEFDRFYPLGSGNTNLEYSIKHDFGDGDPDLACKFDNRGIVSIDATDTSSAEYGNSYTLTIKDKYVEGLTGTIKFYIYKSEEGAPNVEIGEPTTPLARTVTFDAGEGAFSGGNKIKTVTVNRGESLGNSMPEEPTRQGHRFVGWRKANGTTFTGNTTVINDVTVYAQWEVYIAPKVTVTFNHNYGGYGTWQAIEIDKGTSLGTLFPPDPERPGWRVTSWNTRSDGRGATFTSSTIVENDITVYARWERVQQYTVTFYNNYTSRDNTVHTTVTVNGGSSLGTQLPAGPTRKDYTFTGWWTARSGGSAFTENTIVNGNTSVYAQWTSTPQWTVTFYKWDNVLYETIYVNRNTALGTLFPADPTRENHIFTGWKDRLSGNVFTSNTTVTRDTNVDGQWNKLRNTFSDITVGDYIVINGYKFQKISDEKLLLRDTLKNGQSDNMRWSDANTIANGFKNSFSQSWITDSGLLTRNEATGLNQATIRNIGNNWWLEQENRNNAYYVSSNGNVPSSSVSKTNNSYRCRPYITLNGTDRIYVNSGNGTSYNPYTLVYE